MNTPRLLLTHIKTSSNHLASPPIKDTSCLLVLRRALRGAAAITCCDRIVSEDITPSGDLIGPMSAADGAQE